MGNPRDLSEIKQCLSSPHAQAITVLSKQSRALALACVFVSGAKVAHSVHYPMTSKVWIWWGGEGNSLVPNNLLDC